MALDTIQHVLGSPSARLLSPGKDYMDIFQCIALAGHMAGNHLFDTQIAIVCIEHGATQLLTCDRDFMRFPDLTVRSLK